MHVNQQQTMYILLVSEQSDVLSYYNNVYFFMSLYKIGMRKKNASIFHSILYQLVKTSPIDYAHHYIISMKIKTTDVFNDYVI